MRIAAGIVSIVALALLAAVPATGATFKFGSKLDSTIQPSNAGSAHYCNDSHHGWNCTWVMNEAYGRPNGGHKSPRNGRITKIRLIAGAAGSFRIQIVKVNALGSNRFSAKVVRNGPVIHYQGQADDEEPYRVESFNVSITVKKSERLAIRAIKTSTLRCSSGGPNTLLYHPPLVAGGVFRQNTDHDGCWMLVEAVAQTTSSRPAVGSLARRAL